MVARRTGRILAGAALAAVLAAGVLATGAAGARRRPATTTAVGVSAREYRLAAYRATVPRGIVRFNLTNFGEDVHDLVVLERGREVGRSAEVRAGRRTTLQLRLAPGRYRLICDIADHEARGMRTSIRVRR